MTEATWSSNNAALFEKSYVFLKNLLDMLAKEGSFPEAEGPRLHSNPLYKLRGAKSLLTYSFKIIVPKAYKMFLGYVLTPKINHWSIAYAEHNNFTKSLWRYKEIQNQKGRFFADPFVVEYQDRQVIFAEDFFYSDNKGRISAIEITESGDNFLGIVLEEDFHLSFPFLFQKGDELYMVPETSAAREIRLYKCIEFPKKWIFEETLVKDIDAADSMILERDGTWFLLTNVCTAGTSDHQSELHIYYSDNLLAGSWRPIKISNPVIFDSRSARNGGLFSSDGCDYRINQIHGNNHYGKAFGVNKILKLSKDSYIEKRVSKVEASFKEGINSTHHFSANNQIAVFDFSRSRRISSVAFK